MGIATITSAQAVAIMKACGKSQGLSDGMVIKNEWKPYVPKKHDRQEQMDAYRAIPSQYSKVLDK